MTTQMIIQLIVSYSLQMGVDPNLALAVAKVESSYRPNVVGPVGEIGLFQVRPKYSKFNEKQLRDPHINIKEGLRIIKFSQKYCPHKTDKSWIICYNLGVNAAKRVKHPKLFPYYKKVMAAKEKIKKKEPIQDYLVSL